MAKNIGPNFANELKAAGLLGLPFAWSADGSFSYHDDVTDEQKAAIAAVYAAHDPAKPDPVAAAAALLAAGVAVTSAATPAVSGTYGCRPQDQANVTGLQVAVVAGVFPGYHRDLAGARHVMTGEQFTALATAILAFIVAVNAAEEAALAGGAWVAPSAEVEIA